MLVSLPQGRQQALEQGLKQGVAHSLVEVYEARFGEMPEDLRAVVEDTAGEPTRVAWLRLAGTRSVDEIAAAIRSFRASQRKSRMNGQNVKRPGRPGRFVSLVLLGAGDYSERRKATRSDFSW